jgi:hypothetical protein
VIDGEAVVLGVDGIADFDALHSRRHDDEVQLYAFDILALDGEDLRGLPLSMRKTNLARLLARRPDGIFVAPTEQGEIGPDLFRAACRMGLEGLVSKRRDRPYQAGRSRHWLKVKKRLGNVENRRQESPQKGLFPIDDGLRSSGRLDGGDDLDQTACSPRSLRTSLRTSSQERNFLLQRRERKLRRSAS